MCHYSLLSNSLPHLKQKIKLNIPWPVSHKSYDALNGYSNGYSLRGRDLSDSTLVPNKIHRYCGAVVRNTVCYYENYNF